MKTRKEILQEFLDAAQETLIRIEISEQYLQNKHAQENKQYLLDELSKLKANKTENEDWVEFLKDQISKEN